eukprot:COSAG02_NODE_161_length_32629_cov_10.363142_27_plen_493_part_00
MRQNQLVLTTTSQLKLVESSHAVMAGPWQRVFLGVLVLAIKCLPAVQTAANPPPPPSTPDPALDPALECALKIVAFDHGSSRIRTGSQAALYDGLRLSKCSNAPSRPALKPRVVSRSVPSAELVIFVAAKGGSDNSTGASASEAFATLLRARDAIRSAPCRSSEQRRCSALVHVAAGHYDLNETLELDERDGDATWLAETGVLVGGAVALSSDDPRLSWKPWLGPHGNLTGAWVADLSAVLPLHVQEAIVSRRAVQPRASSTHSMPAAPVADWDYGAPPPLINQLFVDDSRMIRARWPNGDPETTSGICFQNGVSARNEGCAGWIAPDAGTAKQPSGISVTPAAGGWPCAGDSNNCTTLSRSTPNRGMSPTWGCTDCVSCGTFGPYWVNDPPPNHPVYNTRSLMYGWTNYSTTAFWSDIFSRPAGVISYTATNRSLMQRWSSSSIRSGAVHMFHGALWGWWAFNIASVATEDSANGPQINFGALSLTPLRQC